MARFYADIEGSRGEATRTGTASSGLRGHLRGWNIGARVYLEATRDDHDAAAVYLTGGSHGAGSEIEALRATETPGGGLRVELGPKLGAAVFEFDSAGRVLTIEGARS